MNRVSGLFPNTNQETVCHQNNIGTLPLQHPGLQDATALAEGVILPELLRLGEARIGKLG